jgi:type II secretory pathway component PulM
MLDPIIDWFHQQTPKDQQVVKIGVAVVILGILYFALLNPLFEGRKKLSAEIQTAEKNLQFLKQSAAILRAPTTGSNNTRHSASKIASDSAKKFSVNLARIAPKRNNQTSLTIDNTQFNQLISWLGEIQKLGLAVETIDINKVDQSGYVKASITVSGGVG